MRSTKPITVTTVLLATGLLAAPASAQEPLATDEVCEEYPLAACDDDPDPEEPTSVLDDVVDSDEPAPPVQATEADSIEPEPLVLDAGDVAAASDSGVLGQTLARTGDHVGVLLGIGIVLLAFGGTTLYVRRRRAAARS